MQLNDLITEHVRLVSGQKAALEKLGIHTIRDVLMHIPQRYEDIGAATPIAHISRDELITVYGELRDLEKKLNWKTKRYMVEGWLHDTTGKIKIRWFHMPYMVEKLRDAAFVKVTGKATGTSTIAFVNPLIEELPGLPELGAAAKLEPLYPIYASSYGISSRWFHVTAQRILSEIDLDELEDSVPSTIFTKYNLPSLHTALVWAHQPRSQAEASAARKRFAFNEVFYLQLSNALRRAQALKNNTHLLTQTDTLARTFTTLLPFTLTNAQQRASRAILKDMSTPGPMMRLLEGDVGSGKTAVAALVSYVTTHNHPDGQEYGSLQVAYMAPTEVLAEQLFSSFCELFKHTNVSIALMTGSGCKKFPSKSNSGATKISRSQLLTWIGSGEVAIVIGTHALLQDSVQFKHLALAIIDEQHRFGTNQRAQLIDTRGRTPHLLSMTATPIPRTLALTIYSDLDLTLLDEYPAGRKHPITTLANTDKRRAEAYTHIRAQIQAGRQAYVICPRIAPSDLGDNPTQQKLMMARVKSVTEEVAHLKKLFPELSIAGLHGKMTPKEKESVMHDFATHTTHIMVATSVVEVGVNVPNATIILIEGAERFGLSQLHQLRGRVQRSSHQAYCYLFTTGNVSQTTKERLNALVKASDGFALAELDLKLRGAGDLAGGKQWGISDVAMEAIQNLKMVEAARHEAQLLIANDPNLKKHEHLQTEAERRLHLE